MSNVLEALDQSFVQVNNSINERITILNLSWCYRGMLLPLVVSIAFLRLTSREDFIVSDHKMLERVFAQSTQISWAEKEVIINHCLWSHNRESLLYWLSDSPGDTLVIHINGRSTTPVVLSVDPTGPITVIEGSSIAEPLSQPNDTFEIAFELPKPEAIRIISELSNAPDEIAKTAYRECVEIIKPRFEGEPFVHLTIGKRALPIKVLFT